MVGSVFVVSGLLGSSAESSASLRHLHDCSRQGVNSGHCESGGTIVSCSRDRKEQGK